MGLRDRIKKVLPQTELTVGQIEKIVGFLGDEFDLDESVRDMMRNTLANHTGKSGGFEFVLDYPMIAKWRLKPDNREHNLGLRVGYHGYSGSDRQNERQNKLNERLDAIVAGTDPTIPEKV